eukprot:TRINITY_DN5000_c0_g1_i1.p1 TRINITY_DN5000_c0_g1~~TRINITY_DN5000_c0_g1_i1.p1  ORF type:complete len:166 (-),score=49.16 TRINITY_DN5000_c0_g1_i1:26-523(-)
MAQPVDIKNNKINPSDTSLRSTQGFIQDILYNTALGSAAGLLLGSYERSLQINAANIAQGLKDTLRPSYLFSSNARSSAWQLGLASAAFTSLLVLIPKYTEADRKTTIFATGFISGALSVARLGIAFVTLTGLATGAGLVAYDNYETTLHAAARIQKENEKNTSK